MIHLATARIGASRWSSMDGAPAPARIETTIPKGNAAPDSIGDLREAAYSRGLPHRIHRRVSRTVMLSGVSAPMRESATSCASWPLEHRLR